MIVTAPAKINLTLRVIGKRPDGYHAIESVMQTLDLADMLVIEDAEELSFTCSDPTLENDDNLVVRAARLLQARGRESRGAHIHLTKVIPMQAGLGGGSSDAAAALTALNEFWQIRLPAEELVSLAEQLGSDVPFFLNGPTAVVGGRGENVIPVPNRTPGYIVLAKTTEGLSTPQVYGGITAHLLPANYTRNHFLPETHAMLQALSSGNIEAISRLLTNELEGPALQILPKLFYLRERMLEQGCLAVLLCGSGSALFGICPNLEAAQHAAKELRNDFSWTWAGNWQLFI